MQGESIIHEKGRFVQQQVEIKNDFMIRLGSVRDVEDFVKLATNRPYRIFLDDGDRRVNGKSFMEMFCLALIRPLYVITECDDDERARFQEDVKRFLYQ